MAPSTPVMSVSQMQAPGAEHLWESRVRIGESDTYRHLGARSEKDAREAAANFLRNRGYRLVAVVEAGEVFAHVGSREGNA